MALIACQWLSLRAHGDRTTSRSQCHLLRGIASGTRSIITSIFMTVRAAGSSRRRRVAVRLSVLLELRRRTRIRLLEGWLSVLLASVVRLRTSPRWDRPHALLVRVRRPGCPRRSAKDVVERLQASQRTLQHPNQTRTSSYDRPGLAYLRPVRLPLVARHAGYALGSSGWPACPLADFNLSLELSHRRLSIHTLLSGSSHVNLLSGRRSGLENRPGDTVLRATEGSTSSKQSESGGTTLLCYRETKAYAAGLAYMYLCKLHRHGFEAERSDFDISVLQLEEEKEEFLHHLLAPETSTDAVVR